MDAVRPVSLKIRTSVSHIAAAIRHVFDGPEPLPGEFVSMQASQSSIIAHQMPARLLARKE
jgi:hypothetical protein